MKTKKISKKLGLNKKTVAHLNSHQLAEIRGGDCTCCPTCPATCEGATCLTCAALTNCDTCRNCPTLITCLPLETQDC